MIPQNPLKLPKLPSKCLRCSQIFKTINPKSNRICPTCTKINRDQPKEYPIALPHIPGHE